MPNAALWITGECNRGLEAWSRATCEIVRPEAPQKDSDMIPGKGKHSAGGVPCHDHSSCAMGLNALAASPVAL
jgi:hypothetical protein